MFSFAIFFPTISIKSQRTKFTTIFASSRTFSSNSNSEKDNSRTLIFLSEVKVSQQYPDIPNSGMACS